MKHGYDLWVMIYEFCLRLQVWVMIYDYELWSMSMNYVWLWIMINELFMGLSEWVMAMTFESWSMSYNWFYKYELRYIELCLWVCRYKLWSMSYVYEFMSMRYDV